MGLFGDMVADSLSDVASSAAAAVVASGAFAVDGSFVVNSRFVGVAVAGMHLDAVDELVIALAHQILDSNSLDLRNYFRMDIERFAEADDVEVVDVAAESTVKPVDSVHFHSNQSRLAAVVGKMGHSLKMLTVEYVAQCLNHQQLEICCGC